MKIRVENNAVVNNASEEYNWLLQQAASSAAFQAGYRACNRMLLASPGKRGLPRPTSAHRKKWAGELWREFARGWAQRLRDKREADTKW